MSGTVTSGAPSDREGRVLRAILLAACLALLAICIACSAGGGWAAARWVEAHTWLLVLIVVMSLACALWYMLANYERYEHAGTIVCAFVCLAVCLCATKIVGIPSVVECEAFAPDKIDYVVEHPGDSKQATVSFSTIDDLNQERRVEMSAAGLGYADVVAADVDAPTSRVSPSGKVIVVPWSYVRENDG